MPKPGPADPAVRRASEITKYKGNCEAPVGHRPSLTTEMRQRVPDTSDLRRVSSGLISKREPRPTDYEAPEGASVPGQTAGTSIASNYDPTLGLSRDTGGTLRRGPSLARPRIDDDLASLEALTADSLNMTLASRFKAGRFYTYCGDILIAVNPFVDSGLYTEEYSQL